LLEFIKAHPQHEQMKNNPKAVLDAMDEFAAQKDFLISIGPHKAQVIEEIVLREKPKIIVELGGYLGYSAIFFADLMRRYASGGDHYHVWSLEFDPGFAALANQAIDLAGLSDAVTVVTGAADESLRQLKCDNKLQSIDMLFLDHIESLYVRDLKVAMDELYLLKSGAMVLADNVVRPGAPEYRKYVRSHPRLNSEGVLGLIVPGEFEVRRNFLLTSRSC
jgi:catechol O-methyltransferase